MTGCPAFVGTAAYSPFKKATVADQLNLEPHEIDAHYVHFVSLKTDLRDDQASILQELLTYGDPVAHDVSTLNPSTQEFFVVPRTLSPWSSKATNIAHICGFESIIKRIERIVRICITTSKSFPDNVASGLLHDRMTQKLLRSWPDPQELFVDAQPAPADIINLHGEGVVPRDSLQEANKAMGLALDESEVQYLVDAYSHGGLVPRNPFDVELFMFAQVNSEHWYVP